MIELHNKEAENAVIGCILLEDIPAFEEAKDIIKNSEYFYQETHRQLWETFEYFHDKKEPISLAGVSDRFKNHSIINMQFIMNLCERYYNREHLIYNCQIVKTNYLRRKSMVFFQDCIKRLSEGEEPPEVNTKALYEISLLLQNSSKVKIKRIGDGMFKTLEDILESKNTSGISGLTTGYSQLDMITGGLQTGYYIIAARPSVGKEQPLYSKILTPTGWTTMGKVKVGDEVIGKDGKSCNVIGIYPQGYKKVFRVYFNDETYADCGLEHLWLTKGRFERRYHKPAIVLTTKEIMMNLKCKTKDQRTNYSIEYVQPVEFEKKFLPIHPYVLGAFIGDGSYSNTISFHNTELDVIEKVNNLLPETDQIHLGLNGKDHRITKKNKDNLPTQIKIILESLGLTGDCYEKFIPNDYLYSSLEDRIQLLQGLMDTDGYVAGAGCNNIEYSTSSNKLKDGILELVRSLGGRVTFDKKMGAYRKDNIQHTTREYYRMVISFSNKIVPVSSKKHLSKYQPCKRHLDKFIIDIKPIGEYQTKCIMVDSPDHLYVTNDYILTHNTTFALNISRNVVNATNKSVLVFSLEMKGEQLKRKLLAMEAGVDSKIFNLAKQIDSTIEKRLTNAANNLQNAQIYLCDVSRMKASDIEIIAKRFKAENSNLGLVIIDYIQLLEPESKEGNTNDKTSETSRNIKIMADEIDLPVLALSQLKRAGEQRSDKIPDLDDLRNSGSLEQDADAVIFLHRKDYFDPNAIAPDPSETNILLKKNRLEGGIGAVNLYYYKAKQLFSQSQYPQVKV
jgi:replicative DNA helicase